MLNKLLFMAGNGTGVFKNKFCLSKSAILAESGRVNAGVPEERT